MAEGDIAAEGQYTSGKLGTIEADYWRTDDGGNRLRFTDRKDKFEQVFLKEETFSCWMRNASDKNAENGSEQIATEWLKMTLNGLEAWNTPKDGYKEQLSQLVHISDGMFYRIYDAIVDNHPEKAKFRKAGRRTSRRAMPGIDKQLPPGNRLIAD